MVLHLGDDVFVRSASVVAILISDSQPDLAGLLASPAPDEHRVRRIGRERSIRDRRRIRRADHALFFAHFFRTLYQRAQSRTA